MLEHVGGFGSFMPQSGTHYHNGALGSLRRTDLTGTDAHRESVAINSSLMTLARCLEALRWNQMHPVAERRLVPYRESKITHLFRDALHGWGQILLSVNVSPVACDYDETSHVLKVCADQTQPHIALSTPTWWKYPELRMTQLLSKDPEQIEDHPFVAFAAAQQHAASKSVKASDSDGRMVIQPKRAPALQYAALATQIGTAAMLGPPRRGTRPVGPNITRQRRAEHGHAAPAAAPLAARPMGDGLRRTASSPALLALMQRCDQNDERAAELVELQQEMDELREHAADLEVKVSFQA